MVGELSALRNAIRTGARSVEDVDRQLRRMTYGPTTLEKAALSYRESGIAPNTRRKVTTFLTSAPALCARELEAIDAATILAWLRTLEKRGLHPSSVASAWRTLGAITRHAQERRWISAAPWGTWKPQIRNKRTPAKEREACRTVEELIGLLGAAEAHDDARRARGLLGDVTAKCAAAALLGIRQGELAGLRWSGVKDVDGVVIVACQYDGQPLKNRSRPYEIRAVPTLFALLEQHKSELRERSLYAYQGPVFPSPASAEGFPRAYTKGEILTRRSIRDVVRRAGLPHPSRWSATSLRDTFVTLEAHGARGDLVATSQRTRHASIASLVRYLRAHTRDPALPGFDVVASTAPLLGSSNK
jgi:integrase